jgi:hypothetical protein
VAKLTLEPVTISQCGLKTGQKIWQKLPPEIGVL